MSVFLAWCLSLWLAMMPSSYAALRAIPGGLSWPGYRNTDIRGTAFGFNTNIANALNEYSGAVFSAPAGGLSVNQICFNIETVTSFVGTTEARCETVSATTGAPSGTEVGDGSTFTPSVAWTCTTMTSDATLTAGTDYWCGSKITAFTSGSYVQSLSFNSIFNEDDSWFPYTVAVTSTKNDATPVLSLKNSSGTTLYIGGVYPATSFATETWNSTTNPDRRGVRFQVPFPTTLTEACPYLASASDFSIIFYDSDGRTIPTGGTISVDKDIMGVSTASHGCKPFSTAQSIAANTNYRVVILPGDTTNRDYLNVATVNAAGDLGAWPGGTNFHYTSVNGAPTVEGDWTQTTTKIPLIELKFGSFDDGTPKVLLYDSTIYDSTLQ